YEAIEPLIVGLSEDLLNFHPAPQKWSIKDNIVHLVTYQPVFSERIKLILEQDDPSFERYKADDDPEFESWRSRDLKDLLKTLKNDRLNLFNFINALSDEQLKRKGHHK